MDKIKEQANKVGQILFAADTASTYSKTLTLTWSILRETGILLWLVIMLVFVGAEWFYYTSIKLGRSARSWYNSLGEKSESDEPASMSSTGEAALNSVKSGASFLLAKAREQLGVSAPEPPAPVAKPAPAAKPTPEPKPAPPPAPEPKAASPAPAASEPSDEAADDDEA